MQKLAEVCIRRPVFASMIVLALVVVGGASYFRLGVDRFPSVDLPTVTVRTELPGASTEEMETQVSQKIEEVVNTIQGINELRSISSPGNSLLIVTFDLKRNIDVAAQDVRDKGAIAIRDLPGSNVTRGLNEQSLRTMGRVADPKSFNDLVVATINGAPVRIRDIGRAEDGTKEQRSAARLDGVPTVVLEVRRQSGENTVAVVESAKANLKKLAPRIPADVRLEIIFRFVEEKKMRPFEAAREATRDIGLAVLATTLSLVVIFVPVSFMSSVSGRFLYQFGLTAAAAVLVSLLVSFTLTPMMSARLLRTEDATAGGEGAAAGTEGGDARSRKGFYGYIDRAYTWTLSWSMRHRLVFVVLSLVVVASSWPLYRQVKQEYVPSDVDEAEFEMLIFASE